MCVNLRFSPPWVFPSCQLQTPTCVRLASNISFRGNECSSVESKNSIIGSKQNAPPHTPNPNNGRCFPPFSARSATLITPLPSPVRNPHPNGRNERNPLHLFLKIESPRLGDLIHFEKERLVVSELILNDLIVETPCDNFLATQSHSSWRTQYSNLFFH